MGAEASIVLASLILAAAIVFIGRWEIVSSPAAIVRLDRWTGHATFCHVRSDEEMAALNAGTSPPLNCEGKP